MRAPFAFSALPARIVLAFLLVTGYLATSLPSSYAQDWGATATISGTLGVNGNRLCMGEASRGDIGCPTYAPSLSTAGHVSVTGNLSAARFIGDGSALTGITADSTDRIVSGTTSVLVNNGGNIDFKTGSTVTGYYTPGGILAAVGVSTTGQVSSTRFIASSADSVTAPGYSWSGDPNTGLFWPATDTIGFTTNGTEAMRITSSNRVGINTSSPATQLEVSGTISTTIFRTGSLDIPAATPSESRLRETDTSKRFAIHFGGTLTNANGAYISLQGDNYTTNPGSMQFGGTGFANFVTNGGIIIATSNTAAPSTSLHVSGTLRIANGGEACDTNRAGAIRYISGIFQFCDGTGWATNLTTSSTIVTTFASLTDVSYSAAGANIFGPGSLPGAVAGSFQNTAFGVGALDDSGLASNYNSAFGALSLTRNTSGASNSAFGRYALTFNTTGYSNAAFGQSALYANDSGIYNTAMGDQALRMNIAGTRNTGVGQSTLETNTGSYNTGLGYAAMAYQNTGNYNTATGYLAGYGVSNSTDYSGNSLFGASSGRNLTTGGSNTAVGYYAGNSLSSGAQNTLLGYNVGAGITTGSNNILLGINASPYSNTGSNQLNLANAIWGDVGAGTANRNKLGINVTTPTVALEVSGTISGTFVGNGSGLTGITSQPTDRISTTAQSSGARLGMVVADQGTVSFTLAGTPGAAYLHPTLGFVGPGVSTTGPISGSSGYFGSSIGIGGVTTTVPFLIYTANPAIRLADSGSAAHATLNGSSGNLTLYSFNSNRHIIFHNNTSELMRVMGSGLVGIGTSAPSTTLHLTGSVRLAAETSSTLNTCDANRAGAIRYTGGIFQFCDGTGWATNLTTSSTLSSTDRIVSGTTSITAAQNASLTFVTGGTERMRIDENGSIMVGTTENLANVTISGSQVTMKNGGSSFLAAFRVSNTTDRSGLEMYAYLNDDSTPYLRDTAMLYTDSSTSNLQLVAVSSTGVIRFLTGAFSSPAFERMRITSSGIAIGLVTPTTALEVSGTVSATTFRSSSLEIPASTPSESRLRETDTNKRFAFHFGNSLTNANGAYITLQSVNYTTNPGSMQFGGTGFANFVTNGGVGIGLANTAIPSTSLHIAGSVRLAAESSSTLNTCDANRAGAIRYTGGVFQFCDGTGWATNLTTSSTLSVTADATDRISTTAQSSGARLGMVVADQGTISFTLAGTAGAAYLHGTSGLVAPAVSTTTGNVQGLRILASITDSAAAPGLGWSGDTNTGLFWPVADNLGFTTGGTERMRINALGYLGIGLAPSSPLHVSSTANTPFLLHKSDSSNSITMRFSNIADMIYLGMRNGGGFAVNTGADMVSVVPLLYVDQISGTFVSTSLGINKTAYANNTALDVSGTIRISNGGEACDSSRDGAIRYINGIFQFCNGTGWATNLTTSSTLATATDRISTTAQSSGARLGMVVADQGTVSFTLAGTAGAAYLHGTSGLVAPAVSTTTGNVAGLKLYASLNDSAALPGHTWGGDPNTGMFQAATDTIGFATNGSEAMRITSSNRVGINTSSPATQLEISASSSQLRLSAPTGVNANFSAFDGGSGAPVLDLSLMGGGTDQNHNIRLFRSTNTTATVVVNFLRGDNTTSVGASINSNGTGDTFFARYGGNTGVATANPSTSLHVSGSIRISNGGEACDANRSGAMRYIGGVFQLCDGTGWATIRDTSTTVTGAVTDRISTSAVASGAQLGMVVADRGTVSFTLAGTAGAAYLHSTLGLVGPAVSTTTGNVQGIKLLAATNDSAAAPGHSWTGDPDTGIFQNGSNVIGFATNGTERMYLSNSELLLQGIPLIMSTTTGKMRFVSSASGGSTNYLQSGDVSGTVGSWQSFVFGGYGNSIGTNTKMIIDSNGNVGIGTHAPSATLHVSGSIRISNGGEACDANRSGAMRYIGGVFQLCDGTGWATIRDTSTTITAAATDRISTTGVTSGAQLGMVVADRGTVSFTLGGTAGAAYLHPTFGFVGAGVSTTGVISSTRFIANQNDSAAAPGYSWLGDTNTGMFRDASKRIGFAASGTLIATIGVSGLGIGTNAPSVPLQVSATYNNLVWVQKTTTGAVNMRFSNPSDTVYVGMRSGGGFTVATTADMVAVVPLLYVTDDLGTFVSTSLGVNKTSFNNYTTLDVSGTLRLSYGGENCDGNRSGAIRYINTALQFCNGTGWSNLVNTSTSLALDDLTDAAVSNTAGNLFLGDGVGANTTSGVNNVGMGIGSLQDQTTGQGNTAVGYAALASSTQSGLNTALGGNALARTQTGSNNTAVGWGALYNNTGSGNTAVGMHALYNATLGNQNVGMGRYAFYMNQLGTLNTAVGEFAGGNPTTPSQYVTETTLLGAYAGYNLSTSQRNTLIGANAGTALNTGSSNTLLGYNAGAGITTGSNNIVVGANTTPFANTGSWQLNIGNAIWGNIGSAANNANRIGINVSSPTTALDISGTLRVSNSTVLCNIGTGTGTTSCTSDERLKKDITPIPDSLEKLARISGVSFQWRNPAAVKGNHLGVIAQDIEKVFPEVVDTLENGYKTVDYGALIAPVIESIKTLKTQNEALKAENATLKARQQSILKRLDALEQKR